MDEIVLTPEELSVLKELKNKRDILSNSFGDLEIEYQIKKQTLLSQLHKVNTTQEKIGVLLQQKYGEGTIDINTGIFKKT
jgi:hypothetical protein